MITACSASSERAYGKREGDFLNQYKICVYAISKNEEQFVDRWMNAVREADVLAGQGVHVQWEA